ncbi:hypothetical protein [Aquimarina sp. 2201CG5-10]|uniref:hypothetical protein n=1 Tax=Aquimarina callyspongiae TaxID=3098150 RepID=UPI002AB596D7|nr:hypothetical protein [Aquimarina sp. 2201CG5-10]MDY8135562.1 hypothetical protein [Aquimarina sp. 2201CG5-10]
MKKVNSKITLLIFILIGMIIFSSCEKDDLIINEKNQELKENSTNKSSESTSESANYCSINGRSSCDDNLTNDGCNFTSGEGRDMPNQFLMVDMLNNCRTEPLPNNCNWHGNHIQTRIIEVDLSNCCSPAYALNSRLDSWKGLAMANRPNSSYIITNYERISGFMVTTYGPYRMRIRVTYRKKICLVAHDQHLERE